MKILLTGGAGYIGSHTAVELIAAGHEAVIADDLSNSSREAVRRCEQITGHSIPFYQTDVCDKEALRRIFAAEAPEGVMHFAGLKAVGESVREPLRYYRNNLDSSLSLLEVMAEFGVKPLVFSSSATVYGADAPVPYREDAPTGHCTSPYGWTKLMIEEFIRSAAAADQELRAVILRYFNPVGAHVSGLIGEDPTGVPNNLMPYITQVAVGKLERLRIFGNDYDTPDGTGVRDYIHVTDLARGHVAALEYALGHPGAEVFNLGTGRGVSVLELVDAFQRANGMKLPYEIVERRPGDLAAYWADAGKAERVLGWRAEKTVEDICRDAWRWQSRNPRGLRG